MRPIVLIAFVILNFSLFAAASATGLSGSYEVKAMPGCTHGFPNQVHQDFTYSGVKLKLNGAGDKLKITLNPDAKTSPVQVYACDSQEHKGDGRFTGDTYSATCTRDSISIRRVFHQLALPQLLSFVRIPGGVKMSETFEGDTFTRQCEFFAVAR